MLFSGAGFELWHTAEVVNGVALLADLSKWVPTSASRVTVVMAIPHGMTVTIVGEASEDVELYFANAAAGPAKEVASRARCYNSHTRAFCDSDDGRPSTQHRHACESQNDTFTQCKAHCDTLNCTCFDYKGVQTEVDARGTLYTCRVSTVSTTITHTLSGYNAYTSIAPPVPPQPVPLPGQMHHRRVRRRYRDGHQRRRDALPQPLARRLGSWTLVARLSGSTKHAWVSTKHV